MLATEPHGIRGAETVRLETNGVRLGAVLAGPTEGPLVVLLHGFPEFSYGWRRQVGPLAAAGLRVLVPDQRGYNLSDKPDDVAAYRIDALADDVLGLAEALGRQRFAVVGHDWGAAVAWHLAARHPGRVERAAVLNGIGISVGQAYASTHASQALKSWYIGFFQAPVVPELALRAAGFAWLRSAMARTSRRGTFSAEDFHRYRGAWAQPGALTAMLNWYRALRSYARALPAERVRVPLRVIWGDRDAFLEPGLVEVGLRACERGEVFRLAEATHWIQHEEPLRVNRLLIEFLAS